MNARLDLITRPLLAVALSALVACASPEPTKTAQTEAKPPSAEAECVGREVATGSNMVRRVGCSKVSVTEAEAARERLTAMPTRTTPEPGAR